MENFISYDINCEEIYDEEGECTFGDDYWLIAKIFVCPELRCQGFARKLMSDAIAAMRAERPELTIKLVCEAQDYDTDQELLAAFYESFGFEATGDEVGTMELK